MQAVCTAKGYISSGGLIISIAHALGLHGELATIDPLLVLSLDIDVCHHMQLIKNMRDERHPLMIGNREMPSIILPCPKCTDVRVRANGIYNLNVGADDGLVPMDILENVFVDGATDDEFDQRASLIHQLTPPHSLHIPISLAHTIHFPNHFVDTSSGATHATHEDILSELRTWNTIDVERDNMIHAMQQQ